ncbi:MAG: MFS transporter [Spirochaetaceae bacterium]|nr:MAG: MFS transporter [Spirochaetaceae bacterium]
MSNTVGIDTAHEKNAGAGLLLFILGFLAFWANGDNYAAAPLLVSIAEDLNLEISRAALSVTSYMMTFGVFTLLFGPLGDRFGRGRIIKAAAFGTAIFSILGGFAFNFPSLLVFRGFNGAFAAGIFPVTMALIGESFSDDKRQGAIAQVMGMMFLGGASATAIGGIIAHYGSWRGVYILYGIAELILAIAVLKIVPSGSRSPHRSSVLESYTTALRAPGMAAIVGTIFFVGFAVFGSFSFAGHYVQSITGLPLITVGLIVTAFGLGSVAASRVIPRLRMRLKSAFLPVAGVFGALSLSALVVAVEPVLMVIGFFGFGMAFVALQSTLIMGAQSKLPQLRGTAMSLASFGMFVGGATGAAVNGIINNAFGPAAIYAPAAVFVLLAAFAAKKLTGMKPKTT